MSGISLPADIAAAAVAATQGVGILPRAQHDISLHELRGRMMIAMQA